MANNIILIIESGKALDMVKQHIADRIRVIDEVRVLAEELGASQVYTNRTNGKLAGVVFTGEIHSDFCKPKKRDGASYPKKGSPWARRLADHQGYRNPTEWIAAEFGVPLSVGYKSERSSGWSSIGNPLTECGFLYLSEEGPYAMWLPDVPGYVADRQAQGYTVEEPAASFKIWIDGCRRIDEEEWKILVLERDLARKKAVARAV